MKLINRIKNDLEAAHPHSASSSTNPDRTENLEMLVVKEMSKLEHPKKNRLEQGREPTTNFTHLWRRRRDLNPCLIEEFTLVVTSWVIRARW